MPALFSLLFSLSTSFIPFGPRQNLMLQAFGIKQYVSYGYVTPNDKLSNTMKTRGINKIHVKTIFTGKASKPMITDTVFIINGKVARVHFQSQEIQHCLYTNGVLSQRITYDRHGLCIQLESFGFDSLGALLLYSISEPASIYEHLNEDGSHSHYTYTHGSTDLYEKLQYEYDSLNRIKKVSHLKDPCCYEVSLKPCSHWAYTYNQKGDSSFIKFVLNTCGNKDMEHSFTKIASQNRTVYMDESTKYIFENDLPISVSSNETWHENFKHIYKNGLPIRTEYLGVRKKTSDDMLILYEYY